MFVDICLQFWSISVPFEKFWQILNRKEAAHGAAGGCARIHRGLRARQRGVQVRENGGAQVEEEVERGWAG